MYSSVYIHTDTAVYVNRAESIICWWAVQDRNMRRKEMGSSRREEKKKDSSLFIIRGVDTIHKRVEKKDRKKERKKRRELSARLSVKTRPRRNPDDRNTSRGTVSVYPRTFSFFSHHKRLLSRLNTVEYKRRELYGWPFFYFLFQSTWRDVYLLILEFSSTRLILNYSV